MKNSIVFLCSLLASVLLFSCSNFNQQRNASVTFSFDGSLVSRIARAAVEEATAEEESGEATSEESFCVTVALLGDYTASQTTSASAHAFISSGKTLSFDAIPVGSSVYARAFCYLKYTYDGATYLSPMWYGESSTVSITAGDNLIPLPLWSAYVEDDEPLSGTVSGDSGTYTLRRIGTLSDAAKAGDSVFTEGFYQVDYCAESDESERVVSFGTWTIEDLAADGSYNALVVTEYAYLPAGSTDYALVTKPYSQRITASDESFSVTSARGVTITFGSSSDDTEEDGTVSTTVTIAVDETSDINVEVSTGSTTEETDSVPTTLTFTADEGYSSYTWTVDGKTQDEIGNVLTVDASEWVTGVYDIALSATDSSGNYYSYTAQITWTAIYTISFDTKADDLTVSTQYVSEGRLAEEPDALSQDGYTFYGWYTDSDFTTSFGMTD